MQRQKAVSAYFTSKQILPFAFVRQYYGSHLGPPAIHIHFYSNLFIDLVSCHLVCSLLGCISPSIWVTGLSIPWTLSLTISRPKWPLCQLLIVMVFCEKKGKQDGLMHPFKRKHAGESLIVFPYVHHLRIKGCICHFTNGQIHPFYFKVTKCVQIDTHVM